MKLSLINSAFYQAGVDTVTGLKHISRIGFDCVDIATEAVGFSNQEINACKSVPNPTEIRSLRFGVPALARL